MAELKKDDDPFIRTSEALQLFNSILSSYSGIFRVQSGRMQSIRFSYVNLASDPTTAEVGDTVCVGGKIKVCTTASQTSPTWTICGTQT